MNTKNIFKVVAMAMLMPAVLLTTSCSKGDDAVTNPEKPATTEAAETAVNKGYALPVTVNVTRQDDGTRATYNESTKKLEFSTGDKLFVYGSASGAGQFAGELTWLSGGTFSGTIYTQNSYSGTADALFTAASAGENLTATLLPNNYGSTGFLSIDNNSTTDIAYDDRLTVSFSNAFVASETAKATGVEQLSLEQARSYSDGFALSPGNAILNFTVTGLAASTNVTATLTDGNELTIQGDVTTDAEGNATFAMGVRKETDLSGLSLTVAGNPVTITSSSKELTAGKIYNITRSAGGTVNLSTIYTNYTVSNGKILTGTLASNVKISIADGATVTLNNVTINGTNSDSYMWAGISCEGDATIILSGTNNVKGFHIHYPGIHVPTGKTLTIDGTGSLNASSNGMGAGIGGGQDIAYGNIVINSGNITATGGQNSAGIGCGYWATCGAITINGGNITATGGENGAGIGSGYESTCGNIEISGGTITATGGDSSAGIGSSYRGTCGNIIISGGTITATGSGSYGGGAGIGSGRTGDCGNINITSGVTQVTATKGLNANSIGAGYGGKCGTVTIEDGANVTQN